MRLAAARRLAATALLLTTGVVAAVPAERASAATVSFSFAPGGTAGTIGTIGIDAVYSGTGGGGAYDARYLWRADGGLNVELPSFYPGSAVSSLSVPGSPTLLRIELYPKPVKPCPGDASHPCFFVPYDAWAGDVGGVHMQRSSAEGPDWRSFHGVHLPVEGIGGAFRIEGSIASVSPVPDGRVQIDLFQITCEAHDPCPEPPRTTAGVYQGAFATSSSRGLRWTGSVGWPGRYVVFIRDTAADRHIQGFMDIAPGRVPTIDLDATCFGLTTCSYLRGGPPVAAGGFHPINPTRILDTRLGLGITNGPIRTGDGRSPWYQANTATSQDAIANHELKVTGVAGIPETGVSAVLLNVTAAEPLAEGFLSVVPRPPAFGDMFNDQAPFLFPPNTSNLNFVPGLTVPNLVVARVGAGGRIRFHNSTWPVHVVADVAGWFDTGAPGGAGFTGLTPTRILDTRSGLGNIGMRFAEGDDRSLAIAGVAGVPSNAVAVVLNVTAADASGPGYVTAYPDRTSRPTASNLNLREGSTRPNLVVVRIGTNGRIRLAAMEASADLIVDVFGYFAPGGGRVTAIEPTRVFDTRAGLGTLPAPLGPGEVRTVQIAGLAGVPANATAVIANVTVTQPTSDGYLSIWPTGVAPPVVSNLNWQVGATNPNLAFVRLGAGGTVSVLNPFGSAHVLVDVMGYVTP